MSSYEKFKYADPNFQVTFHDKALTEDKNVGFSLHWHEHLEIICMTQSHANITIANNQFEAHEGDVLVINSNAMHSMLSKPLNATYHCLILDKQFCDSFFIPISEIDFLPYVTNKHAYEIFLCIATEMEEKRNYYKARVQAYSVELLVLLLREYSSRLEASNAIRGGQKEKLIKTSINYISSRFYENLTVDSLASQVSLSKYYYCHAFKEMTGMTAIDYINQLRCNHAQKLLKSGHYNISESAFASGFNNLSYFTRTYKKHIGVLPSQDIIINGD